MEKEALIKGMPLGQAYDIEIPPPRPKRKPSSPYPRKETGTSIPTLLVTGKDGKHVNKNKEVLDLEHDPPAEVSCFFTSCSLDLFLFATACQQLMSIFKSLFIKMTLLF